MNRSDFLKSVVSLTGGLIVTSCVREVGLEPLVEGGRDLDDYSLEELQSWFTSDFLSEHRARTSSEKGFKRVLKWDKLEDGKDKENKKFKWVPINYEDKSKPGLVSWNDKTLYKKELKQHFVRPVLEGFVIFKDNAKKNGLDGFLVQIAYDPYLTKEKVNKDTFSGSLIIADWNGNILSLSEYLGGTLFGGFDNLPTKNARLQATKSWVQIYTTFNTYTVEFDPDLGYDVLTIHVHSQFHLVWINDNYMPSNGTYVSSDYNYYGSGFGGGAGYLQGGSTHSAPPTYYNYIDVLSPTSNSEKSMFVERLSRGLYSTGLAVSIVDFSYSKALALVGSLGIDLTQIYPNGNLQAAKLLRYGKGIGAFSVGVSAGTLVVGIAEDGLQWDEEGINALQVGLGIATIATGGWVAVGIGAMSVAISIATY